MGVFIPALCPEPVGNRDTLTLYVTSQPIIQLKELEIDQVRYTIWKNWVRKSAWEKRTAYANQSAKRQKVAEGIHAAATQGIGLES